MADEEEEVILATKVVTADMPDAMREVAIETSRKAMNEYSIYHRRNPLLAVQKHGVKLL